MKHPDCSRALWLALIVAGGCPLPAGAQEEELVIDRNRLMVAARFAFNITADFRSLAAPINSPPEYDDGFVRPDISGNPEGKTWNWGYNYADQWNRSAPGGSLDLHYLSSSPHDNTSQQASGDLQAGFELLYGRELGRIRLTKERTAPWGLQAGFTSLDVNIEQNDTVAGNALRVTHSYNLGGVVPPLAPYAGTYQGPGPLLPTAYTSSTAPVPVTSSLSQRLDTLVLGFKLGPFIEVPVYKRLSLQASAGLAAMDVLTEFQYTETFTVTGLAESPAPRTGDFNRDEWLIGFYATFAFNVALNDTVSLFVGGQYQNLGDVNIVGGSKEATLHLGESVEILVGVRTTF